MSPEVMLFGCVLVEPKQPGGSQEAPRRHTVFPLFVSSRQTGRTFKASLSNLQEIFSSFSLSKKNQMLSQATLLGDVFNQQFNASWPVDVCVRRLAEVESVTNGVKTCCFF